MSFTQRLVVKLLPRRWSGAIRAESEAWGLRCPKCGTVRSLWEMGGIRYKGASTRRQIAARCVTCDKVQNMTLERKR
jgi:hypothetical protein